MCAGPLTLPHSRREDDVELIVSEANGVEFVVGDIRSRIHEETRERLQGVEGCREDAGRIMCALDWEEMEIEVEVVERVGRCRAEDGLSEGGL